MKVAYIDGKTFEIVHIQPGVRIPGGYFYADDILADTIQVLNMRGYVTRGCHAGMPYGGYREATLVNVRDTDGGEPEPDAVVRAFAQGNPSVHAIGARSVGYHAFRISMAVPRAEYMQIVFAHPYRFAFLPKDFTFSDCCLRHDYPAELQGIDFLDERTSLGKCLYDWACALPFGAV